VTFSRVFSQLVSLFPLKRGKRDVRAFASSFGKSFPKRHLNGMGCIGRGVCLVLWCVFLFFVCMHECVRCVYVWEMGALAHSSGCESSVTHRDHCLYWTRTCRLPRLVCVGCVCMCVGGGRRRRKGCDKTDYLCMWGGRRH